MKRKYFISFALTGLLIYGIQYTVTFARIGAAYNAKMACSCLFISGRSLESIEKEDLYTIPFARQTVDTENKIVTSSIYGIRKKAIFRPGLGCTIVNKSDENTLRNQWPAEDFSKSIGFEFPIDTALTAEVIQNIKAVFDTAFHEYDPTKIKRTRAALVVHDGKLIAERYAPGITAFTPLIGWSMTKSVTNAMIGILIQDGKLALDKNNLFPHWQSDDRKNITLDHLLRMSSGLTFNENYNAVSNATKMLFLEFSAGLYASNQKLAYPIDSKWSYSSGTSNILQSLISNTIKDHKAYLAFPHQRLFDVLGMKSAVLEPDASGTYVGSSYMFATARDWAKFGQLYINDGLWFGQRILPEGWVRYSSTVTPASDGEYAAHFWTYPRKSGLPDDSFLMDGFEGQLVLIVPSKKLLLLRLGCTPKSENFDGIKFFKSISDLF
jgi:CubicO group peptidase (beta-lactamase class C family)